MKSLFIDDKEEFFNFFEKKSTLKKDVIEKIVEEYQSSLFSYKFHDWFRSSTNFGDTIVEPYLNKIFNLNTSNCSSFDSYKTIDNKKVLFEIKSFRCMSNKTLDKVSYYERALLLENWKSLKNSEKSNGSLQQLKPRLFDFVIGAAVAKDNIEIVLVPSNVFTFDKSNKDMLFLSGQHRGNLNEGQIGYNKLKNYVIGNILDLNAEKFDEIVRSYLNKC